MFVACDFSVFSSLASLKMTTTDDDLHEDVAAARQLSFIFGALGLMVPGILAKLEILHSSSHALSALFFGMAIVGSAFLLSWAAEVAQLDISAGLAIAILALIAVLPEYAVDLVFARKGGHAYSQFGRVCKAAVDSGESNCSLALANMTGANRLLIGVGWALVVFLAFYASRRKRLPYSGVQLERSHSVEIAFLTLACAYSLTLPLKTSLTLFDALILVSIFIVYTVRISKAPAEEPHLVGPARLIGNARTGPRRTLVISMFVVAAGVIGLCAGNFADSLKASGAQLGISEFFLVQWLAPLASEAPELLVAGLYAWRLNTNAGLGTLVSSKVNQWTLLVGTLPIAFAVTSGGLHGLPLDGKQREELFLTAAQSVFAVAVLANLSLSAKEAAMLFVLFCSQFAAGALLPGPLERTGVGAVYLLLGVIMLLRNRKAFSALMRDGLFAPFSKLAE